jgi:hypothetical protein
MGTVRVEKGAVKLYREQVVMGWVKSDRDGAVGISDRQAGRHCAIWQAWRTFAAWLC